MTVEKGLKSFALQASLSAVEGKIVKIKGKSLIM
jgi:hypothetical protein